MRGLMWVVLSVCFGSGVAWAENPKTIEVWRNLFTLSHGEGVNSNLTFLITKEGVVVVDTRVNPAEARKVKEAIRRQPELPILYAINTHYHGDHTIGNQVFRDSHNIVAHENVRKALEFEAGKEHLEVFKSLKIPGMEETVVTPPNILFRDKMDIYAGEYHLELIHVKGHTDGDLFICLLYTSPSPRD